MSQDVTTTGELPDNNPILKERARALAKPISFEKAEGQYVEVLEFFLSGERYALPMHYIKEVTLLRNLTPLPGTPDFILGVISIRGRVISVTDLRVFFDLPRKGLSDYNKIILLAGKDMEFAVLADKVTGVTEQNLNQLSRPPDILRGVSKDFLSGVFPGPLIFIDAESLLRDKRLIVQGSRVRA